MEYEMSLQEVAQPFMPGRINGKDGLVRRDNGFG
jgi:hypothetical protein